MFFQTFVSPFEDDYSQVKFFSFFYFTVNFLLKIVKHSALYNKLFFEVLLGKMSLFLLLRYNSILLQTE